MTKREVLEKLERFNDPDFQFDEATHTYHYKGVVLQGVSSFVSKFKEPFNAAKWAPKKAKERGITTEAILAEWKEKNTRACDMGSMVHEWVEKFLVGEPTPLEEIEDEEVRARCVTFKDLYRERLHKVEWIAQEVRMFDEELGLAGTFDSLGLHGGEVFVCDHKTNGRFTDDDDRAYRMLKPPFHGLKENTLNTYSIQQSAYALMLERAGIPVKGMALNYIPPEGPARVIKCKDLRPIIKHYYGLE
jgi:ATP-dependent exoDNAse (exonuclease V) beta subunit